MCSIRVYAREYSEATAARLDEEIKALLDQREQHVRDMLTDHKEALIRIAERLLEKEVIYEDEFKSLI